MFLVQKMVTRKYKKFRNSGPPPYLGVSPKKYPFFDCFPINNILQFLKVLVTLNFLLIGLSSDRNKKVVRFFGLKLHLDAFLYSDKYP